MKITLHKYQGTGNDFVVIDNRNGVYNSLSQKQIKFLCDRRFGVGADGLMLLNSLPGYDFEMKYYNADGSESTMCGNGGRCLVRFAEHIGIFKDTYLFMAIDGGHEACKTDNDWIKLKMKDVNELIHNRAHFILDTGSPHYVKLVDDVKLVNVLEEGSKIRNSEEYASEGINVNFVEVQERQIFVRTYERGVENETLSCGTGVTAAALVCAHNDSGFNRVEVETPGGHLAVEFKKQADNSYQDIWLCGPATFVFEAVIEIGIVR